MLIAELTKIFGANVAIKEFKRIDTESRELNKIQDNIKEWCNQVNKTFNDGIILDEASVGTTTVLIEHKLGRMIQGWGIVDINADARVWRDATSTADLTRFLPLKASASATIKLYVY